MESNSLLKIIGQEKEMFINRHGFNADFDVEVCQDIYTRRKELICGPNDCTHVENEAEWLRTLNGTVALGKTIDSKHFVLLSDTIFSDEKDYTWYGTVHHEATHLVDYLDLAKANNIENMDEIYKTPHYNSFLLWSEYHARCVGYTRVLNIVYNDSVEDALRREARKYCMLITNSYTKNQSPYEFMQLVGRYFAISDIIPNFIPPFRTLLQRCSLTYQQELNNIFRFIKDHRTFSSYILDANRFETLITSVESQ